MEPSVDPTGLELRGRLSVLEILAELVARVRDGQGAIGLIQGEAGIGKTRLADFLVDQARRSGLAVAHAVAQRLEGDRPFGVLTDALAALGEQISARDPPAARYQVIEGFVDAVERAALERPLVIVLEDLHWADAGTPSALHRLARTSKQFPVGLVLTFRPTPQPERLATLLNETAGSATMLALGPLEDVDMAALAAEFLGAPPGPRLGAALASTGGNPLFATELLAAFRDEGSIEISEGTAELREVSLPRALRVAVLRRLAFLERGVLELLKRASVLGSRFSLPGLAALADRSELQVAEDLEEPLRAGLVVPDVERFGFQHELVRDAVYAEIPEPIRRMLHRRAAEALMSLGTPRLQVASHISLGAEPGDPKAIDSLREAAREATATEPAVAVPLLERALDLCAPGDPRSVGLRADLVLPMMWSGRQEEAARVAREGLASCTDREWEVKLRSRLAQCLEVMGRATEAIDELKMAARLVNNGSEQARLYALMAFIQRDGNGQETMEYEERALELADRHRDDLAQVLAQMARCWSAALRGELKVAIAAGRHAVEIAERSGHPEALRWIPHRLLAVALRAAGAAEEVPALLERGRAIGEATETTWHLPLLHITSGIHLYSLGAWDDAIAEFTTALDAVGEHIYLDTEICRSYLAAIYAYRGDVQAATATLAEARGQTPVMIRWAESVLGGVQGDPNRSADSAREFTRLLPERSVRFLLNGPDIVRAALAAEDRALAEEVTRRCALTASRAGVHRAEAAALRCRGLVRDEAELLQEAIALYRDATCPVDLAATCEEAGAALLRNGRKDAAVALLEEARSGYEEARADWLLGRVDARLRDAGVRRGTRARARRSSLGWDSLTDTENRVLGLIAEGLPNRQIAERMFISKRTVETHVSHLFRKLETKSRSELIAQALRERPPDVPS